MWNDTRGVSLFAPDRTSFVHSKRVKRCLSHLARRGPLWRVLCGHMAGFAHSYLSAVGSLVALGTTPWVPEAWSSFVTALLPNPFYARFCCQPPVAPSINAYVGIDAESGLAFIVTLTSPPPRYTRSAAKRHVLQRNEALGILFESLPVQQRKEIELRVFAGADSERLHRLRCFVGLPTRNSSASSNR